MFAASFTLIGCGGEPDHTTLEFYEGPEKCVPGEHKACWCDGVTGFQQCRDDGMAFMHCECPPAEEDPTPDAGTEVPEEAGTDAGVNLLRVWSADEPQGGEVRPGDENVPVLGLNLQALQTPGNVNIRAISLGCRASLNGQEYADTDCWRRVREIEVLDEDGRQIAPPDSPDMVAGKVYLLVDYTVEKGETRNLLVRASFNDNASTEEPYDRVSFDLVPTINADQGIETDGATVVVGHGFGLGQQGDEPKVEFTLVPETEPTACPTPGPHGALIVTEEAHPPSTIVVAGDNTWKPMARYKVCTQGEEAVLEKIAVQWRTQGNDAAAESFEQVGVAFQGNVLGTATFDPADPYGLTEVNLNNGVVLADGACAVLELWASFVQIKSSAQVNEEWQHQPRSGKSVALRIGQDVPFYGTTNSCDQMAFMNKLFIHASGLASGEKLYASQGAAQPNYMTARKARPIVTHQPLASQVLINGEVELARMLINADGGSVAIKQVMMNVNKTSLVGLNNFRLLRGSFPLPTQEYSIINAFDGSDLYAGAVSQDNNTLTIAFAEEEVVSGNGQVYSLRATVQGATPGQWVAAGHLNAYPNEAEPKTGYLLNNDWYAPYAVSSQLFHVGDYTGCDNGGACWHVMGAFVWSDMSENPHSTESRDWTNEQHVLGLAQTWQLN